MERRDFQKLERRRRKEMQLGQPVTEFKPLLFSFANPCPASRCAGRRFILGESNQQRPFDLRRGEKKENLLAFAFLFSGKNKWNIRTERLRNRLILDA
jgi:hypothetical protein